MRADARQVKRNVIIRETWKEILCAGSYWPAVWRSYERIETMDGQPDLDDQWLQYVSARLGAPGRPG